MTDILYGKVYAVPEKNIVEGMCGHSLFLCNREILLW